MLSTAWLAPVANLPPVRRFADSVMLRMAHARVRELDSLDTARIQEHTLLRLIRTARRTRFGRDHDFDGIASVADFQARVPIRDYDDFWQTYWKNAYPRLDDVTWPGKVPYYALSSGTTTGTTKYIPVTREMVHSNTKAGFTTLSLFRHAQPTAPLFTGKMFFLGGSTDLRRQDDGSLAGDLSGIAIREVAGVLRPYTFPPVNLALLSDWEKKVQVLAEASAREPITVLSGVPAWLLVLFDRLKQVTGKSTIAEIWPTLRMVVHGGTKFDPYRDLFVQEIGNSAVRFIETYPCSEGFVATEDPRYELLRLVPDHNIFFEFVPVEDLEKDHPTRHTIGQVEVGVQYAVVLTSCAGVWSYLVGDTICFERRDPPLLRFTGRTKYFLSAFGEHLISEEVEKAIAHAAAAVGGHVLDFHVGPVFPTDPRQPGHHRYLVEFAEETAPDAKRFAAEIDAELSRLNEDYAAHRVGDLSMHIPEVVIVAHGGFAEWMKSKGKFGGQHKVPRMDNTGQITREMHHWFVKNGLVKA